MNWMNKLEKKIGRYAISNLSLYFVIAYMAGIVLSVSPLSGLRYYFMFDVASILHGQIWRLVSWILVPMPTNVFLGAVFMLCVLSFSHSLERIFGAFKMNVYIIGGILLYDLLAIVEFVLFKGSVYLTTYYMLISFFMLLAICVPEAEVRIWFVLPVKMKWMLIFYFLDLGYELYTYFSISAEAGIILGSQIIFALLNLGLFVLFSKPRRSIKQLKRHREFRSQFSEPRPGSGITKHKCAICGRTEEDDPNLSFRFCSKCVGAKEYCQEHLFTHTHITGDFNPYQ